MRPLAFATSGVSTALDDLDESDDASGTTAVVRSSTRRGHPKPVARLARGCAFRESGSQPLACRLPTEATPGAASAWRSDLRTHRPAGPSRAEPVATSRLALSRAAQPELPQTP